MQERNWGLVQCDAVLLTSRLNLSNSKICPKVELQSKAKTKSETVNEDVPPRTHIG